MGRKNLRKNTAASQTESELKLHSYILNIILNTKGIFGLTPYSHFLSILEKSLKILILDVSDWELTKHY